MNQAEVFVGATVIARIGGQRRPVLVRAETQVSVGRWVDRRYQRAFLLRDKASGRDLPKARRAAALRHTRGSWFGAVALPGIVRGLSALHGV